MNQTRVTTKDRILEILKKRVRVKVSELTEHLEITDMAVRKHLSIMEKDGLIQAKEIKLPMGRPTQMYSLSEKGERLFPKNYEGLSVEFMKEIRDLHGDESIVQLFQNRERRLSKEYSIRMEKRSSTEKIKEMAAIQNEKGYMADLIQIDKSTFELIEYNCPIMAVAKEFKVACHCETSMFKTVLNTDHVKRTSCKTEGNDHCKFLIKVNN
ncbi:helix-turn-helix transcriptional regulator [Aquibacillus kalidii]|uniref:helix-turn-helix transcriptional regulator n=1 Tax=Aquibacillus kalidii TaxID=2762597 RepID=UPI001646A11E